MINPMDAQGGGIAGAMPTAGGAMPQAGGSDPRRPQGTVGKDLLDALVAAKLLREKKMAQNELMLSMENDPQTVAEKNEAELQGLTQQEITKGVSGVLQNKQRKEQKNLQLAAKGQGQPRRGGSPGTGAPQGAEIQTAGIADIRMAQAAAQGGLIRMAQGGIVGFQEGQEVGGEEVDAETQNKIVEYVKENPWATALNAAALVALVAPVPGGRPLSGLLKLGATGAKYAPKIAKVLGKAFTKPKPGLQGRGLNRVNTGQPMGEAAKRLGITDDVTAASRQFDPLRSAGVLGTAGGISSLIEGGGDEKIVNTGKGDEDKKVITPVATPPAVAPEPEGESYYDRRSRFARAGAKGGISGFGEAMTEIETTEREQELEGEKIRLQAEYQQSIVDAQSYNNAVKNLLAYNKELNTLISEDPSVIQAGENLRTALSARGGKGKNVAEARGMYDDAMKKAMVDLGNSVSGGSLLANIAALEAAIKGFRASSGTAQSADVAAALKAID